MIRCPSIFFFFVYIFFLLFPFFPFFSFLSNEYMFFASRPLAGSPAPASLPDMALLQHSKSIMQMFFNNMNWSWKRNLTWLAIHSSCYETVSRRSPNFLLIGASSCKTRFSVLRISITRVVPNGKYAKNCFRDLVALRLNVDPWMETRNEIRTKVVLRITRAADQHEQAEAHMGNAPKNN